MLSSKSFLQARKISYATRATGHRALVQTRSHPLRINRHRREKSDPRSSARAWPWQANAEMSVPSRTQHGPAHRARLAHDLVEHIDRSLWFGVKRLNISPPRTRRRLRMGHAHSAVLSPNCDGTH